MSLTIDNPADVAASQPAVPAQGGHEALATLPGLAALLRGDFGAPAALRCDVADGDVGDAEIAALSTIARLCCPSGGAIGLLSDVASALMAPSKQIMLMGSPKLNLGMALRHLAEVPAAEGDTAAPEPSTIGFGTTQRRGLWRLAALVARTAHPRRVRLDVGGERMVANAAAGRLWFEPEGADAEAVARISAGLAAERPVRLSLEPSQAVPVPTSALAPSDILAAHSGLDVPAEAAEEAIVYDSEGWPVSALEGIEFSQIALGAQLASTALAWRDLTGATRLRVCHVARGQGPRDILQLHPDGTLSARRPELPTGETPR